MLARLEQVFAFQPHGGAVHLRVLDLRIGRAARHDDGGRDSQARRMVGHRLSVVSCAHGNHAPRALGLAERQQLVQRPTLLERGGELQVLELQENLRPDEPRKRAAVETGRLLDRAGDALRRGADVVEGHRHRPSLAPKGRTSTMSRPMEMDSRLAERVLLGPSHPTDELFRLLVTSVTDYAIYLL